MLIRPASKHRLQLIDQIRGRERTEELDGKGRDGRAGQERVCAQTQRKSSVTAADGV